MSRSSSTTAPSRRVSPSFRRYRREALPSGRGLGAEAVERRNADLRLYAEAAEAIAAGNDVPFLDIFDGVAAAFADAPSPLTVNGLHLNEAGYWHASRGAARRARRFSAGHRGRLGRRRGGTGDPPAGSATGA